MIKIVRFTLIILFAFSVFACEKETETVESFAIKYGSECGWCAGQEYIIVNSSNITYTRNIPCGEDQGTTTKNKLITPEQWEELNESFDYSLFLTLNYNECNVCVDGCDEIIEITNDTTVHELRYSFSDKVEGMEELRNQLSEIMSDMRED